MIAFTPREYSSEDEGENFGLTPGTSANESVVEEIISRNDTGVERGEKTLITSPRKRVSVGC